MQTYKNMLKLNEGLDQIDWDTYINNKWLIIFESISSYPLSNNIQAEIYNPLTKIFTLKTADGRSFTVANSNI